MTVPRATALNAAEAVTVAARSATPEADAAELPEAEPEAVAMTPPAPDAADPPDAEPDDDTTAEAAAPKNASLRMTPA